MEHAPHLPEAAQAEHAPGVHTVPPGTHQPHLGKQVKRKVRPRRKRGRSIGAALDKFGGHDEPLLYGSQFWPKNLPDPDLLFSLASSDKK